MAEAATFYVATNGSDSNAGTITAPFRNISKGLSVLAPGGTLYVRGGTYPGINSNNMLIPNGTSWSDAPKVMAYPGETVILTGPTGFAAPSNVGQSEVKYFILNGFKLDCQGGFDCYGWWGRAHHTRIQNCEIYNSGGNGVGGWLGGGGGGFNEVINCKIHDYGISNSGAHGLYIETNDDIFDKIDVYHNGGINQGGNHNFGMQLYSSTGVPSRNIVRNSSFHDNRADNMSYGLVVYGDSNLIYNNLFYGNVAGVYAQGSGHKFYNNTIYGNTDGAFDNYAGGVTVKNNVIYANGAQFGGPGSAIYGNNICGSSGTGCSFVANPSFINAGANDFHLQSASPAINYGTVLSEFNTDKDGNTRAGNYDAGAYEYTGGIASLSGDLNGDRIVNSLDWSLMSAKWLTNDALADLNKDGAVNSLDWSIMSGNWLKTI